MSDLPSKDMVLEACTGTGVPDHAVLRAARELAGLHASRNRARFDETDCARAVLVHDIDCWVSAHLPPPCGAAYLHSESVGTVIDRIARYVVDAHAALEGGVTEMQRHYRWQRLTELVLAYADLAHELGAGRRKVPALIYPDGPGSQRAGERR